MSTFDRASAYSGDRQSRSSQVRRSSRRRRSETTVTDGRGSEDLSAPSILTQTSVSDTGNNSFALNRFKAAANAVIATEKVTSRRKRRRQRRDFGPPTRQASNYSVWDPAASPEEKEQIQRDQELAERLQRAQADPVAERNARIAMKGVKDTGNLDGAGCDGTSPVLGFVNVLMWVTLIGCIVVFFSMDRLGYVFIVFGVFYVLYLLLAISDETFRFMNHVVGEEDALNTLQHWNAMKPRPWLKVECFRMVHRHKGTHKRVSFSEKYWLECESEDKSESPDMSLTQAPLVRLRASFALFFASADSAKLHENLIKELWDENKYRDHICEVTQGVTYDSGGGNHRLVLRSAAERPWWLHRPLFLICTVLGFGYYFVHQFLRSSVDFDVKIQKAVTVTRIIKEEPVPELGMLEQLNHPDHPEQNTQNASLWLLLGPIFAVLVFAAIIGMIAVISGT